MPKLQEYISQGGISRGRSLVVSPSQIDTRGVSGAISEAGKAILEAEQAMVRVRDFRETTEGMNFVYDKSRAIKSLSREDDGFDPTRYFAELNNTVTDAAKNITGEIAREEFILKAQRQVDAIKADIRDSFRAREIKAGQAGHGYQKKMGLDAVGDMTDAEEVTMINGVRRSLEEGLGLLWNQDYVDYEMKTFEKDIVMAKATYQTITNPEGFLGIIEKDVDKIYELLDDAEKAGFVSDARKNLLDYEAQERNNASIQLSALYREDNLTMDSLNVIQANNPLMTDKEYDKWAKVIENRDSITGEANSSVFYDLSSEFMKAVGTKKLDKLKTKSFNRKQIKNILIFLNL